MAGLGWRRGALSADGAVAATAVGASTFGFGGLPASLALIAFFATGSALSRRKMVPGEVAAAKGHRRDAVQVFANGGIAAVALAASAAGWRPGRAAALGALAAAAADTWASEIGVRSPSPPRSIVTGEVVPPGASGGVTPLGWLAAAAGALVVGGAWVAGRRAPGLAAWRSRWWRGSRDRSRTRVAGATIQAGYALRCVRRAGGGAGRALRATTRLVRGRAWVTNDVVNLIGTATGAVVGAAIGSAVVRAGRRDSPP